MGDDKDAETQLLSSVLVRWAFLCERERVERHWCGRMQDAEGNLQSLEWSAKQESVKKSNEWNHRFTQIQMERDVCNLRAEQGHLRSAEQKIRFGTALSKSCRL